ncbi:hypothetical protein PBI_SUPERFRESH_8 [Microbacterium phage Superfresh]|nr:hypothetical protein PBI_PEEP_8 [Microbacterium phage Peep]AUX83284.1 hypothetical protein PBI_SUPERFRESH_8 [Microbacterium phage Superfresh]AVR56210.1 hypothetical protein PBI_DAVE_8 [Microbacterium phage Dave]AVR56488.1 hypothetical protein PBI_ROBINSON_8 [Microbacterium phage Robinson]AVR56613.1 hypothetical protein PBI_ANTOINETTE_8 [Microbacterium phage Antoinette]QJD50048.1 hypothetical protein SEA_ZADA_8 [Microbacterium phage Zada]
MACTDCNPDPVSETEGAGVVDEQETPGGIYDHAEIADTPEA